MRILVLLSTYNGEKYLKEQLDSLYAQIGVEINILVRDDGSKDETVDILQKYKQQYGKMTILNGSNLGAGPSFMALINEAATNYSNYEYYAFSDQDDVWFDNKVLTGVNALENSTNKYQLFFSGSIKADARLNSVSSSSMLKVVNSFGANVVSNHILGCTMLFNQALLLAINKINTEPFTITSGRVPIHDGWTACVAYSLNADVVYQRAGLMYYRQHENNVVGAGQSNAHILLNRIKRYLGKTNHFKSNKCIIASQVLGPEIPEKNKQLLERVANYKNSLKAKLQLLSDSRMYEYGMVDNIGTFFMVLFNRF